MILQSPPNLVKRATSAALPNPRANPLDRVPRLVQHRSEVVPDVEHLVPDLFSHFEASGTAPAAGMAFGESRLPLSEFGFGLRTRFRQQLTREFPRFVEAFDDVFLWNRVERSE